MNLFVYETCEILQGGGRNGLKTIDNKSVIYYLKKEGLMLNERKILVKNKGLAIKYFIVCNFSFVIGFLPFLQLSDLV